MKRTKKIVAVLLAVFLMLFSFAACGNKDGDEETSSTATDTTTEDTLSNGKVTVKYTNRDLAGTWEESEATEVVLSEESYTITTEGVYVFSGTLADGQILVDAADTDKVQIVLNGVDITCSDGPAILVENAKKTFITLAEGSENSLTDGSSYSSSEDQPWGTLFSKDDLTINGTGALVVTGNYNNGIVSKDDLTITSGAITVTAVNDGIRGRNSVAIYNGEINISAQGDGIKSNNDEDEGKGYISIDGGEITITDVSSQGIDAYYVAQIMGGSVKITSSNEGIQGRIVYVADGTVDIDAVDDCLNATDSSATKSEAAQSGVSIEIVGGDLKLATSNGDGLDSNGDLYVSGGKTVIYGSTGGIEVPLDYNGEGVISGGTVIGIGTGSQMAQNFDEGSSQGSILYNGSTCSEGTEIVLSDSEGNVLAQMTADRSFNSVIVSAPDMAEGETYTLKLGDESTEIELTSIVVTEGTAEGFGGGGFGGPGGGGGQAPGGGKMMEKPN